MKRTNILTLTLALILALTACGSKPAGDSGGSAASEPVTIQLGVVGGIYEDLWTPAQEALKAENINLEFVQFSDYVTPNNALANGEIDLNAFQHRIYLQSEVESYGYEIETIGNTFIIPLNIYSDKVSSVEELKDGDVVAIPDDLTNGGRALKVLEAAGLIALDAGAGFSPTVDDITAYSTAIEIEELKANVIPSVLPDVATAKECGYDIIANTSRGVVVNKNTDPAILEKIQGYIEQVVNDPAFLEDMKGQGYEVDYLNPTEYRAFLDHEYETLKEVAASYGW